MPPLGYLMQRQLVRESWRSTPRPRAAPPTPTRASWTSASAISPPKTAKLARSSESESLGLGMRVIADGSLGFRLHRPAHAAKASQACAAEAVAIARASALAKLHDVVMVPEQAYVDTWQNRRSSTTLSAFPLERQLDLLLAADAEMRSVKGVTLAETVHGSSAASSSCSPPRIGSRIHQMKMQSGAGIVATSFRQRRNSEALLSRTVSAASTSCAATSWSSRSTWSATRARVAEEAVALHKAAAMPRRRAHDHSRQLAAGPADSRIHRPSHRARSRAGHGSEFRRHEFPHAR